MLEAVRRFFDKMVQKYLPDAFLFAIIFTFVVLIMGLVFTESSSIVLVVFCVDDFWVILDFFLQLTLIVVTGYVLANTPVVKSILSKVSTLAKTPAQAIVLVTFIAAIASLINYGFGLVVGALLAIQIVKKVPSVDYRLLV